MTSKTRNQPARLVFQPHAHRAMQSGINWVANAVRPTLGPIPRFVAVDPVSRGNVSPLLLDDGAMIARRILELPDADQDMGAMFCRRVLWDQHEQVGDGTVLTAVMFQSAFNQGLKHITAGGNAMMLRRYLERGLCIIKDQLSGMVMPLEGVEQITALAESVSHDSAAARSLGEIFDVLGAHGMLDLRSGYGREVIHEFVEGVYFKNGLLAKSMMGDGAKSKIQLEDAALLVSEFEIDDAKQLVATVGQAYTSGIRKLVIIAKSLSEQAAAVLVAMSRDTAKFHVIAVKTPDEVSGQAGLLEDIALLTGARLFLNAVGDKLSAVHLEDLGYARRVWANPEYFGIVGPKGSPLARRQHLTKLEAAFEKADKPEDQQKLRQRIGILRGGSATLHIGGVTETEIKTRKDNAERTVQVLRGALRKGVLPGGGVALLACQSVLRQRSKQAQDFDEKVAYNMLSRMLEEPIRTILSNAGHEPEPIMATLDRSDSNCGFDARTGEFADVVDVGIFDSAEVLIEAVTRAISSAALALTIDVFVHHKKPEVAVNP